MTQFAKNILNRKVSAIGTSIINVRTIFYSMFILKIVTISVLRFLQIEKQKKLNIY